MGEAIRTMAERDACVCSILPSSLGSRLELTPFSNGSTSGNTIRRNSRLSSGDSLPNRGRYRRVYDGSDRTVKGGRLMREEGMPPTGDPLVDEAYEGAGAYYDFLLAVFGRNSLDDRGRPLDAVVRYRKGFQNALWDGRRMLYGYGETNQSEDQALFNRFTQSLDVVGHELTHGLLQCMGQLNYSGQAGALNESFADVMGSLLKQWKRDQKAGEADWLIGENLFAPRIQARGIRSLACPGSAFDDPILGKDTQVGHLKDYRRLPSTMDHGGVHINSGIPNRAFYVTASELGGYAWEQPGLIWYLTYRDRLSRFARFETAARMTQQVAQELFGMDSREAGAVKTGWEAVGVSCQSAGRSLRPSKPAITSYSATDKPAKRLEPMDVEKSMETSQGERIRSEHVTRRTDNLCPSQLPDSQVNSMMIRPVSDASIRRDEWVPTDEKAWEWINGWRLADSPKHEWSEIHWRAYSGERLKELGRFTVRVMLEGDADAVGLSLGHFKDFLVPLQPCDGARLLELEVDVLGGCWAFRVNGVLQAPSWSCSAVKGVEDLVSMGTVPTVLSVKGRNVRSLRILEAQVIPSPSHCRLSVILTCNRFLQRLRIVLQSWCNQQLPFGEHEVLVVNPQSPDGTHEYLDMVSAAWPHVRIREVPVRGSLGSNKGAMINRACQSARGDWIWLTDADCLFPLNAAAQVLAHVRDAPGHLYFGERLHLSRAQTALLLTGRADGCGGLESLLAVEEPRAVDSAPNGYSQVFHRITLKQVRYPEHFNTFARSDDAFVDSCKQRGIYPQRVPGLRCVHLDHPFAWNGTQSFL